MTSHRFTALSRHARLLTVVALLAGAGAFSLGAAAAGSREKPHVQVDATPLSRTGGEPLSFAPIAKKVAPSVVKITTETKSRVVRGARGQRGTGNPQLDEFFAPFFGPQVPELRTPPQAGLGSGVIVSKDGYIVTNNHVVAEADVVTVTMDDGAELRAEVVGRDPQTDIAVIKVDAKDLPAITFADSSIVEVGDRVLAIGNPFGLGETVTSGIVSATSRRAGIGLAYEDFIQTDAAINPGNSGGALVDLQGRLIGINTAIFSRSGGFQGVGLAVPADLVRYVTDQLVAEGRVTRGYLGVGTQDLTPGLAEQFGLKSRQGVVVTTVQPDSPAAAAGLVDGDVITSVNGQRVDDANRLRLAIGKTAPKTTAKLELLRDGKPVTVEATVAEHPESIKERERAGGLARGDASDEGVLTGVAVADLTVRARRQFEIPPQLEGALITQVEPDSASARAGLRPGDVILEINRQPVADADTAVELSEKARTKKTLLKLWSRGGTIYTVVDETVEG